MNQGELITLSYDPNWPTDKMVNDHVESSKEISDIVNKAVDNLIVGTWFLLKENGHIFISKEEPTQIKSVWTLKSLRPIGWLQLDEDGNRFFAPPYNALTREMFNKLQLPEVLEENVPLEIEVMPSGNVYFY